MLRKDLIFASWQRIVLSWVKIVYTLIEATCCKAGSVASPETMASLWTVLKCRLRFDTTLKALIQMSHMKGFSSLCTSICCFSLLCEEKLFRHLSHQNGLTWNMFLKIWLLQDEDNVVTKYIYIAQNGTKLVMKMKICICKEICIKIYQNKCKSYIRPPCCIISRPFQLGSADHLHWAVVEHPEALEGPS